MSIKQSLNHRLDGESTFLKFCTLGLETANFDVFKLAQSDEERHESLLSNNPLSLYSVAR